MPPVSLQPLYLIPMKSPGNVPENLWSTNSTVLQVKNARWADVSMYVWTWQQTRAISLHTQPHATAHAAPVLPLQQCWWLHSSRDSPACCPGCQFCGGDDVGCAGHFCAKDSVLPIADCFRFALALLSPTVMSLFNTGLTPRDAEARANALPLLFWSRALLRAAGCFVPAHMQVPAGGSGCRPRGQRCSLLTYNGLFPFLLQLAPAPTATLTLFTILTPVEHER